VRPNQKANLHAERGAEAIHAPQRKVWPPWRRICYGRNHGRFQPKIDSCPRDIAPQPDPPTLLQHPAEDATRAAPADGTGM